MSDRAAIFEANVRALALDDLAADSYDGWRVEWTGAWPSIAIEGGAGQWSTLHSRRAPIDEARTLLAEARGDGGWPHLVVLLGAGLGYAVDVVAAEAPPSTRVLVVEPFAAAAAAMLSRCDWRSLVEAGRLSMIAGPQFAGAADLWRSLDPRTGVPLVVEQPVLARVRPDAIAAARKVYERAAFDAAANNEARETLGGRYLVNTLFNLPRIAAGFDLRALEGAARGRTAVVCGAGPSLNRNLEAIRPVRDAVVLVAVDTALRPILEAGLAPDFVVALDPAVLNARHLSGLRLPPHVLLIAEAALDPSAFDSFGDRVAFFRVGGNDPWPWLVEQGLDVPVLAAWGSVLTSALAFAELLDCDPVVMAGADLAWTDGQPYCRGTAFEVDWARVVLQGVALPEYFRNLASRKATEQRPDVRGEPVATSPHLVAFRDWLVDRAAKSGRRVMNITGAGLLHGPAVAAASGVEKPAVTKGSDPFVTSLLQRKGFAATGLQQALAELRDDGPPLSDWIAGYARSLDRAMLDQALGTANLADSSGGAGTEVPAHVPSTPRALIALPEALGIIRAARDGAALPEWATQSPAWDLTRAQFDAATALGALLRRPRLGTTIASGDRKPAVSGHLQLLYDLEWPQPVLEAVSAMLIDTAGQLRVSPPADRVRQRFRSTRTSETSEAPSRHADRRAQVFLATLHATRLAAAEDGNTARTALALLDATGTALDAPPAHADARVRVTLGAAGAARRWRVAASLASVTLIDALRGAVFGAPAARPCVSLRDAELRLDLSFDVRTVDRDVIHRAYLGTATCRVLTEEGLPRCLIATPSADGSVIATPRGQMASYRVTADGRFAQLTEWPAAIVGEVHGPAGQVAWTYTTPPRLLFRENDGGAVTDVAVPFQTYTARWWQNHVVLTTSDGLWLWRPGQAAMKIADVPPAVIAQLEGDRLDLDPLPLEGGKLTRTRLTSGFSIALATRVVSDRALEPPGQRWLTHEHGGLTATGFPQADVVRITHRGAERMLLWPSPRTAAWIGRTLLINTAAGDVVVFPNLAEMATRAAND